jgi:hypothetical protein
MKIFGLFASVVVLFLEILHLAITVEASLSQDQNCKEELKMIAKTNVVVFSTGEVAKGIAKAFLDRGVGKLALVSSMRSSLHCSVIKRRGN